MLNSRSTHPGDLIRRRNRSLILAAAAAIAALAPPARAGGNFDGGQIPIAGVRKWDVGGVNPGINWDADTLPPVTASIFFDTCGDGIVDMNGLLRAHPSLTFADWVSYNLTNGTFALNVAASTIKVGGTVGPTYGSDYFADGTSLSAGLDLGPAAQANSIFFAHNTDGALRIQGPITGQGTLDISRLAGGSNVRPVYFDNANAGYIGNVTVNSGTEARLLSGGSTGGGQLFLQQGSLAFLSNAAAAGPNNILATDAVIRGDHDYTAVPVPPFAPGSVYSMSNVTLDHTTSPGAAASLRFTADNGYNFSVRKFVNGNTLAPGIGVSRTVSVINGDAYFDIAGSTRQTGPNRLNELVVTTTIGIPANPSYLDIDSTGLGQRLRKDGSGVLAIDGDNQTVSKGAKDVLTGVLRFNNALAYGTTTGIPGGVPVPITLLGGAGPVSAGFGVAYNVPLPVPNLATTGATPGQSGALDVDFPGHAAPINLNTVSTGGAPTAYRLGSSASNGKTTGAITSYTPVGGGFSAYYLGGGGGTLEIASVLGPGAAGFALTRLEMGTSGQLLPGRVRLINNEVYGGATQIRAGTLEIGVGFAFSVNPSAGTSLGAYSTALNSGAEYTTAPAGTPYNGPGQLLLDEPFGTYIYGGGGSFGGAGLLWEGGALGWNTGANEVIPFGPGAGLGVYGATKNSTLYTTIAAGGAPVATYILHFGGEYATSTMVPTFAITNNGPVPVALLKSGINNVLDLTALPAASVYTGGTGILGGEIKISNNTQLGPGTIVIADGGTLHVVPGAPVVPFSGAQHLRVSNGIGRRASTINVDGGASATFNLSFLEANTPGSILRKTGAGDLRFTFPGLYPTASAGNTWGLRASGGNLSINQLPGTTIPNNGSAIFDGGTLTLNDSVVSGGFAIPGATKYSANYGFAGLQTYPGTASMLFIDNNAFFRITGAQTSSLMGELTVQMGPKSVFKLASGAGAGDTRGTGRLTFYGGNVQLTPAGAPIIFPRDGAFTLALNFNNLFSGCPQADFNGNLLFNNVASPVTYFDAATVSNAPAAAASTWTIGGTGTTSWSGMAIKDQTEAIPGAGGPFVTGTVNFERCQGAPVTVFPGAILRIEHGTINAGGTGDPFTDTSSAAHLPIANNATFNITAGDKHVASIAGTGTTTVFAGATLDVGSSGPVTQSNFVVNGKADVGAVNTSFVTSSTNVLIAGSIRANILNITPAGASVTIKVNGGVSGVSYLDNLNIAGTPSVPTATLDLNDNDLVLNYAGPSPYTNIKTLVFSGFGASTGITSSTSDGTQILALFDNALVAAPDWPPGSGNTISGTSVVGKYTYFGDVNFDGQVTGDDYTIVDSNLNTVPPVGLEWLSGDANLDGMVTGDDYTTIDSNLGLGVGSPLSPAALGASVVPESTAVIPVSFFAIALLAKRCRKISPG